MTTESNPQVKQVARRVLGCWVTVLVLLVGLPVVAVIVWQASGTQRVEAMKAAIRRTRRAVVPPGF